MSRARRVAALPSPEACARSTLEETLAARFQRRIVMMATFRLGDREAAEDVAQETLRRVVEALRLDRLHDQAALPAFVYQTARNVCLKYGRKRARENRALRRLSASADPERKSVLTALIEVERRRRVRRALDRLGDSDRRLLKLLYYEELDPATIAERLGVTHGALRVRRHRALRRLNEILEEEERAR